ncbi:MAG: Rrf2 family transcriptional regulator [Elusimicrobiales bacterium]|nr:Rrf2 family transcriptional regulator [Elusimicrobiales bacterium]
MQITLETDYAVRCMVYLKDHRDVVSALGDVAKGTRIPQAFLSKILQKMIKGGLVKSSKGKSGGFRLAKEPDRISVYNIMQAVCGCETVMKVVCSKTKEPCTFLKSCKIHIVWQDLGKIIKMILESRKLSQL